MNLETKNEHTQNVVHFASLIHLAFADNEFRIEEYELLEKYALKLGITEDESQMILDNPSAFSVAPIAEFKTRLEFVYDFFKIIYADDRLNEAEYKLAKDYIQALGFNAVESKIILSRSIELFEKNDGAFVDEEVSLAEYERLVFGDE